MAENKQQGNLVAIIMMIILFGMISFVTNLAAPMGIVLKAQFNLSNFCLAHFWKCCICLHGNL